MEYQQLDYYILKRIASIPSKIYNNALYTLNLCGITSHDKNGNLILINELRKDYNKVYRLLEESDIPDNNGIKQLLVIYLTAVQTITGKRMYYKFIATCQ